MEFWDESPTSRRDLQTTNVEREQKLVANYKFQKFGAVKESEIMLRFHLIEFYGTMQPIESFSVDELVQRCYTILSFIKVGESAYQKCVINNLGFDSLSNGILRKIVSANMGKFIGLKKRIMALDPIAERNCRLFLYFAC